MQAPGLQDLALRARALRARALRARALRARALQAPVDLDQNYSFVSALPRSGRYEEVHIG
ncbi:hypothetical protein GCM10023156_34350 [Novipirellula rosea]|uniref:Uncharacterized protein n=1 Tax=Novipirellula rosea TaxID=1031540 RepID=A0ABP8MYH9_9BACT